MVKLCKYLNNFRISSLHQKIDSLKNLNVDFMIIKKFDQNNEIIFFDDFVLFLLPNFSNTMSDFFL